MPESAAQQVQPKSHALEPFEVHWLVLESAVVTAKPVTKLIGAATSPWASERERLSESRGQS